MTPRSSPRLLLQLTIFALAAACRRDPPEHAAPVDATQSKPSARPFALRVPDAAAPPAPLVVLLHGYGGTGAWLDANWGIGAMAAAHGWLVAIPEGTPDPRGNRFWNASRGCCDFDDTRVDDVAYIDAIVDDASRRARVDPKRVYVIGFSNGGFMAHRYACDRAARVAAIVSVAGAGPGDDACAPSEPVSVLQVHGDADTMVGYDGGRVGGDLPKRALYPSVNASLATWRARNGCGAATDGEPLDLERSIPGAETTVTRASCRAGAAVELWTVRGAPHSIHFQPGWAERVHEFLAAHAKP